MAWAIEQRVTTDPNTKFVLICLANYADKLGKSAFPSVASLCEDTLLSERSVRYKLAELEQLSLIRRGDQGIVTAFVKREDRRPICYEICMPERGAPVAPRDPTGCKSEQNGVQMTTERGAPVAPNPILRSVIEPKSVQKTFETEFEQRFGVRPAELLAQQKRRPG